MEVWRNRLDDLYDVYVVQDDNDARSGRLFVERDGNVVGVRDVGISFGAIFGPDVGDVNDWCEAAIEIVDSL